MSVCGWKPDGPKQLYIGVADGVGSWRQYGVDPRLFSHKLIENAKHVVEQDAMNRDSINEYPFNEGDLGSLIGMSLIFTVVYDIEPAS